MALPKQEFLISAKDETKIAFDSVKSSIANIQTAGLGLNNTLGTLAPLLGAATFSAFLKGGIDSLDMLGDLSDRTGIAASTLSGFKLVAAQSDTSLEALGNGINKLSLFMANNADEAKKLGLSAKDPAEAFIQLAGILENASSVQERNAVANKVLGKSYAELLPSLNQGADALRAQIQEGQALAGVTDESVKQAQAFNDELDKLKLVSGQLSVTLGSNLLPGLTQIADKMKETAKEGGLLKTIFSGLGELGKVTLFGTDAENMKLRADFGIPAEMTKLVERIKNDATGFKTLTNTERYAISLEMKALANERNNLKKLLSEPDSEAPKKTAFDYEELTRGLGLVSDKLDLLKSRQKEVDAAFNAGSITLQKYKEITSAINKQIADTTKKSDNKSQAQKDAEAAAKSAQDFTEKLQKEAATLGLTKSALLEYDAAQLKLNANQAATVQASIEKIGAYERQLQAVKDLAEFENLLQESDERQLATLEEQSQAEQQIQAAREADYQSFYDNLVKLNEDLNVDLITSDKKRAQAQIDLENERAIERINSLGLETEEVERLLELQAEAYEKQSKKITQQTGDDFGDLKRVIRGFGDDAAKAFSDFARGGKADFSDLIDSILSDLERLAFQKMILDPIFKGVEDFIGGIDFGGIFSGLTANANGGVYSGAGISKYSNTVVSKPTIFPFAKGTGLMGEAGPEAILPLSRSSDGRLGVQTSGGSGVNVFVNLIETSDKSKQGQVDTANDGNGMTINAYIESIVDKKMINDIGRGRGVAGIFEQTYGLNRAAGAR